jgi:hypothetical protein
MSTLKTLEDYKAEIERVKKIIMCTHSEYLKRDMCKYLKRLQREMKKL